MRTALITGASSGLGAEFARQLAADRADLVLVARTREPLDELAAELRGTWGVNVEVLTADLTRPRDMKRIARRVASHVAPVSLVVNNAGFGLPLHFADNDVQHEVDHLRVHVEAPMRLMHAAIGAMRGRGGRIINVASVAGFIPRSTYSACKAWLIGFSRWANNEYAGDRISVTAVCPGFTHTNFHERMGLPPGDEGIPNFMWLHAPDVVREALRDAARGKAVSIPSLRYKAIVALTGLLPAGVISSIARRGRV